MLRFLLALALAANGHAQLYVITGSYNQAWNYRGDSILYEVAEDGKITAKQSLVSSSDGFTWIGISHDLKRAAIPVSGKSRLVRFLDLETATVYKECPLPPVDDYEHWIGNLPGVGFVMFFDDLPADPAQQQYYMVSGTGTRCEEGVKKISAGQLGSFLASGSSGVGDFTNQDGLAAYANPSGEFLKYSSGKELPIPMGFTYPGNNSLVSLFISINNPEIVVTTVISREAAQRTKMVYRKRDRSWHKLPDRLPEGLMRAFGKYICVTEAHTKKAVAEQLRAHPNQVTVDQRVMKQEVSAGRAEWSYTFGPDLAESFATSDDVFPGQLHIFDTDTKQIFTITTNQGNSEILLIDHGIVYYRVSHRIYRAAITARGLRPATLMAQDAEISDAHWAFFKR